MSCLNSWLHCYTAPHGYKRYCSVGPETFRKDAQEIEAASIFDVFYAFCEYWASDASRWSWWHLISCLVPINHWRGRTRKWRKSNLEGWKNCGKRDGKTFHVSIRETHRSRMFVFAKMFPLLGGLSDVSVECLTYVMFYLLSLFPLDLITFCLFWSPTFLPQRRKTLDFLKLFFAQKTVVSTDAQKNTHTHKKYKTKKKQVDENTLTQRDTNFGLCLLEGIPGVLSWTHKKRKKKWKQLVEEWIKFKREMATGGDI